MAGMPRESAFMPTVKCSTCGKQVEISLMGEHACLGGAAPAEPVPPMPAASFFDRLNLFGVSSSPEKTKQAPPKVDTSAANQSYMAPGQLTPVSLSSGSRSVSPKTPNSRQDVGRSDDYFAPKIARDSPPPQQSRRPGGYGGLGGPDSSDSMDEPPSPKKQAPSLLQRMNTIAPGPFDARRRPSAARNAFPMRNSPEESNGFGDTNLGSSLDSSRPPRAPRKNGYGGFGPPGSSPEDFEATTLSPKNRADTFPSPKIGMDGPSRTPSEPGPRPDRFRRPSNASSQDGRPPLTSERFRRPSRGPDTSRPPPPRTSLVRPATSGRDGSGVPSINLDSEFGMMNPYHAPSASMSSNGSGSSRSAVSTQPSSAPSPSRTAGLKPERKQSDTSGFDNLMADIQSSMAELQPKQLPSILVPPPTVGGNKAFPLSPRGKRPPRPDGYDPRIDPAVQNPRPGQARSPLASPTIMEASTFSRRDDPAIQPARDDPAIQPPRREASRRIPRPPSPQMEPPPEPRRSRSRSQSRPREAAPTTTRSRSRPRDPAVQSARGDCKACGLPITGKSISSADGRLTGRYHKACFVCTTCKNPFSSATFYVLDDKPYCEYHYHKLNGSLCGTCTKGIEGQYLEDESTKKHHVGCFRCGDCGMVLRDGYFEVNGKAYCENDAWRRAQQQQQPGPRMPGGRGRGGSPMGPGGRGGRGMPGPRGAGPGGSLAPPGARMGGKMRMEKRMTRIGMM